MTSLQYLEFDSTYRNRVMWPLPSDFRIDISQTGNRDRFHALDPISDSAVKIEFNGSFRNDMVSNIVPLSCTPANPANGISNCVGNAPAGTFRQCDGFYVGAVFTSDPDLFGAVYFRKVIGYTYMGTLGGLDYGNFEFDGPLDFFDILARRGNITNPSDPTYTSTPSIFIPSGLGGGEIDNFYKGCILTNLNTNESRVVTNYDSSRHLAEFDVSAPGWSVNDNYVLRRELSCNSGIITIATRNTVVLNTDASSVNNFYVGGFIRIGLNPVGIIPPFDPFPAPYGETRRIVSYDGSTRTVTFQPELTVTPTFPNNTYSVECYSRDNVVPFNYIGSLVSQQQAVCYDIELINVVLSNRLLCSSKGGRIAFYPYLYIGLESVSSSTSSGSVIYSNNPNSKRKMFRAIVDDIPTPLISPFVKIDGDGMVQTVKFKPNDSFHFTVCHADGDLFKTEEEEYFGPSSPNPLIQISALFSIRRVI